jgi:hypothetical protein
MVHHEGKGRIEDPHFPGEIDLYGDPGIASYDAKIPKFLLATYLLFPIWGIVSFYYFWNGSMGWFDRGYWRELQIAANTTFPIENQNMIYDHQNLDEEEEEDLKDPAPVRQ